MLQRTPCSLVLVALLASACGARSQTIDDAYAPRPCVVVDAGPRDLGAPDLGGGLDAGPPAELDLVGAWHRCSLRYVFGADGRYLRTSFARSCETEGGYRVAGRTLVLDVDRDTCATTSPPVLEYEVVPGAGGLVMVGIDGSVTVLADDATPRETWALVGETSGVPQQTTLHVVDPSRGPYGSSCYWSTDGRCGGLFSCSGNVANWRLTGSDFLASTSCDGGCPCVAMSLGSVDADGTVRAAFTSATCGGTTSGSFVATPTGG